MWVSTTREQAQAARDKRCRRTCDASDAAPAAARSLGELPEPVPRRPGRHRARCARWTPLPETADELCEICAQAWRAGERDSARARAPPKRSLKDMSESGPAGRLRDRAFRDPRCAHGPGAERLAEPGLILTPPAKGTSDAKALERDDGFLTASEIAALKLDADWVILSACNTAGASGETAEALSGMARAFFYAGARALLVSHWEVGSDAAVKLTTRAFVGDECEPEDRPRRGLPRRPCAP